MRILFNCLAALLSVQPLANEEVLEPSVANEVAHALERAPLCTSAAPTAAQLPFATNGLSQTQMAIRLVSSQRADGRWCAGTNDVTAGAVKLLKEMLP